MPEHPDPPSPQQGGPVAPGEAMVRRTRHALMFGAGLLVLFGVGEALVVGRAVAGSIVTRIAWAALALGVASLLLRAGPGARHALFGVLGGTAPLFYAALVWFHGGIGGVPFDFFAALPLVVAVLLQGEVLAAAGAAVATPLVGLVLLFAGGAEARHMAEWGLAIAASSATAAYGAVLTRRMMAAERASQDAALEAQRRLAERDRALADADRLALVGHLASGLSHEVNNPLGSLVSNLSFLEQELASHPPANPELAEVVRDLSAGADRIAAVMREISASAPVADDQVEACSLADSVREAAEGPGATSGLVVVSQVSASLPRVQASAVQLRRALAQLFAALAEPVGEPQGASAARLVVTAREEPGGVIAEVRAEPTDPAARPAVSRGRARASLGLALIRESMRQWGGDLTVESESRGPRAVTLRFQRARFP
jgi:signal transduction histidine kinase